MRHVLLPILLLASVPMASVQADVPALLPAKTLAAIANEVSGATAKRNLEGIGRFHMDMVGGGLDTKSVFHVTRGPMSLPSFVHDVAWAFAAWVNDQTYRFAATGEAEYPLISSEGGKDPAAAHAVEIGRLLRTVAALERGGPGPSAPEQDYERGVTDSLNAFGAHGSARNPAKARSDGTPIFRRRPEPKGPLAVFGYDYFDDHTHAAGIPTPRLLSYASSDPSGKEDVDGYTYEALNFADGRHSARQIAECLSAEYGPVPTGLVVEYLQALQKIGVVD